MAQMVWLVSPVICLKVPQLAAMLALDSDRENATWPMAVPPSVEPVPEHCALLKSFKPCTCEIVVSLMRSGRR